MTATQPIVVAGEALVDLVLEPDGAYRGHPGGGPYNVARTIGRLGQPVRFLGSLSSDEFGRKLRARLDADAVRLDAIVATDAPTTLALAELDAGGGALYRFYEGGTSAPGLTLEEAAARLPVEPPTFYLGTLGLVFEPMATTLETLVARLGDRTLVALDPNCRPSALRDPGRYRDRLGRLLGRADVVKVSADDLAWLDPTAEALEEAARRLLAQEHAVALVTLGGDGALLVTRSDAAAVEAPVVEVVDTIGAGDAFMGAFLAWWSEQELGRADLRDRDCVEAAARRAARVASLTCARAGAEPPRLGELE
jgi:fructokinase